MATEIWVNIGSGNGLLPDSTKPLHLNQCWLNICEVQWYSYEGNLMRDASTIITLTGELWGVCCEDLRENWPCYNGTGVYVVNNVPTDVLAYNGARPSAGALMSIKYSSWNLSGNQLVLSLTFCTRWRNWNWHFEWHQCSILLYIMIYMCVYIT